MAGVLPVAIIALYLVACDIYYRYWNDLLPLTSIFNASNWNGFVAKSLPDMFGIRDALLLLIAIGYGAVLYLLQKYSERRHDAARLKTRFAAFAGCVAIYLIIFAGTVEQQRRYLKSINADNGYAAALTSRLKPRSSLFENWGAGLIPYFVMEIKNLCQQGVITELSDEDRAFIEDVLRKARSGDENAIIMSNRDKNLILIIVESLNADIVGRRFNGQSLTPTLDSLMSLPGTITALNLQAQVGAGGSSDGQMICNTGLLPVYRGCTAQLYGSTSTFPSLVKLLNKQSAEEYIVEDGRIWFHNATSLAYGYDRLNDATELKREGIDPDIIGSDEAIFEMALRKLPKLRQPFFAEIVTLSMHFPYNDPGVPRQAMIDSLTDIGPTERNYMQMTHYFDARLGAFLKGLKAEGLYDNSVIVITSDHDQEYKDARSIESIRCVSPIVFMALNTGVTAKVERSAWQMDVFPTILDIMGCDAEKYRGTGRSLLREPASDAPDEADCKRASDLIIRGNYFGKDF